MTKFAYTVIAEFEKETGEGWLSYQKAFKTRKEASDAFEEAQKDVNCLRAELIVRTTYQR